MSLRLEIVSQQRQSLGERGVKSFGQSGGTIGRSLESDWVLPDSQRFLSSRHATIDFRSGSYYIIDTSTNGVFINGADDPVGRGKPQRLFSGDRIRIGDYEVVAEIADIDSTREQLANVNHVDPVDARQRVDAPDPTGHDLVDAFEITGIGIQVMLDEEDEQTLSPLAYQFKSDDLELEREPVPEPGPQPAQQNQQRAPAKQPAVQSTPKPRAKQQPQANAAAQQRQPAQQARTAQPQRSTQQAKPSPQAKQPAPAKQPTRAKRSPKAQSPKPAARTQRKPQRRRESDAKAAASPNSSRPDVQASGALDVFFAGAGLPSRKLDAAQIQETLHRLGQIMRAMIDGMAENLQLRAMQKARLQQSNTTIQPLANNPLKFSAGVEEAINNVLFRESDQYLSAVDAIRGALSDIHTHQRVLMEALQNALADYLSRFDPEILEDKFAGGKRGKIRDAANRLKYWDLYKDLYLVLSQHPTGELPQLFLDELARAYEVADSKAMLAAKDDTARRKVVG